jgi:glucose dehydrogenase
MEAAALMGSEGAQMARAGAAVLKQANRALPTETDTKEAGAACWTLVSKPIFECGYGMWQLLPASEQQTARLASCTHRAAAAAAAAALLAASIARMGAAALKQSNRALPAEARHKRSSKVVWHMQNAHRAAVAVATTAST